MALIKWNHEYTSGQSHANFEFPDDEDLCSWFACLGAGTVVMKMEGGTTFTFTALGGEVVPGRYTQLVSTSCSKLWCGNGAPMTPAPQTTGTSAASSLDSRVTLAESVSTSIVARFSTADASLTTTDASIVTRFSTADASLTTTDASIVTRFSTSVVTLTSADTSLTTRVSVAESVEANIH